MSLGQRSITTGSPAAIGPEPMSCPTALCGPCETMNSSATVPCAVNASSDRRLDPLGRERLAVDDEPGAVGLGAPQQVARRVHPGLGRALSAPDAGQLGLALDPAAVLEEVVAPA